MPPDTRGSRIRLAPWLAVLAAVFLWLLWWPFDDSGVSADHHSTPRMVRVAETTAKRSIPPSTETGRSASGRNHGKKAETTPGELAWSAGGGEAYDAAALDGLTGMGGPGGYVRFSDQPEGGDPGPALAGFASYRSRPPAPEGATGGNRRNVGSTNSDADAVFTQARVHLEVDRHLYEMSVFADGNLLWRFPVGLGKGSSTPTGDFVICNKIAKPDWYHRGRSIPYGDPRNPLGESWMGLAAEGVPLSYGIHPTDETASIGDGKGAGCIRMRPEDAETLFRFCPIGTTVHIGKER